MEQHAWQNSISRFGFIYPVVTKEKREEQLTERRGSADEQWQALDLITQRPWPYYLQEINSEVIVGRDNQIRLNTTEVIFHKTNLIKLLMQVQIHTPFRTQQVAFQTSHMSNTERPKLTASPTAQQSLHCLIASVIKDRRSPNQTNRLLMAVCKRPLAQKG